MEREETEEKESVRKAEKERHEMKYKVGDKVKVRSDLEKNKGYGGWYTSESMVKMRGEIVTIRGVGSSAYELEENDLMWTDEMFEGLADDELTAEEAIKLKSEMCETIHCSECKFSKENNGEDIYCNNFIKKYPERVVEALKQLKKEHEKKEVETEFACIVRVIEDTGFRRRCVYEEDLAGVKGETFRMAMERVLKEYCKEHEGKFFAVYEEICRVKE